MTVVVDTSAIVAILQDEPEKLAFTTLLSENAVVVSAGTLVETLRLMRLRRGEQGATRVRWLMEAQQVELRPVDNEQVAFAEEGMARFGKGRGAPPAVLNFGDLFAYALARHLDAPLLFKGNDFPHTDVKPALSA